MIIYNVTIKVDHSIADEWLNWLKQEHIPDMQKTGCFSTAHIYRLLETDESDGITYAVQYQAPDYETLQNYFSEFSAILRKKGTDKWGNKFVAFRSVLQLVH